MAKRVDANQPGIVKGLRQVGARVWHTFELGHGFPDILVLFRGELYLLEIKMPGHRADLTDDEVEWHGEWQAAGIGVVDSLEEALRFIGAID